MSSVVICSHHGSAVWPGGLGGNDVHRHLVRLHACGHMHPHTEVRLVFVITHSILTVFRKQFVNHFFFSNQDIKQSHLMKRTCKSGQYLNLVPWSLLCLQPHTRHEQSRSWLSPLVRTCGRRPRTLHRLVEPRCFQGHKQVSPVRVLQCYVWSPCVSHWAKP